MSVEEVNKIDIPKPNTIIKEEETLDKILESKNFNEKTLKKAKPIFEKVQKSFQDSINDYIKDIDTKYLSYIINNEEEPIKYLIEDIDITTGMKIIDITKKEEIDITNENADITNENADITNENADITNENADITNETQQEIEIKSRQELINEQAKITKDSYDELNTKYKTSNEQINKIKENSKNKNLINQITEKVQGTELSVDEYLKYYITAENNKKELKNTEFMKNYEELNDILNIAPETLPFSETTNPNKTDDLIDNNESLNYYANNSDALADIEVPLNKELTYDDEEFDTYVKFIEDDDVRKDIKKNQKEIQDFHQKKSENTEETPDDEAIKNIYQQYTAEIGNIKNEIADSTQKTLQKRILGSCISWLASYFDNTTIDKKTNFADDFDVNSQDGFSIENDILDIKGKINGSNIGFSYNMMEWKDTNLQADNSLNYDKESDSFTMDIDKRKKSDLGIKMPTIAYLRERAERFTQDNLQKTIEKSRNNEDFQKTFKQDLSEELAKEFGQKTMVETRVKRDIQKNITVQTLQETFIPEEIQTRLNEKNGITAINEKNARELLNIRDTTTENMRSDELETFNKLIIKFDNVIQELENNNGLEKKRKDFFGKIDEEKSWATEWRGTNILSFFQKISKNDKINLQDLEVMISVLEKDASSIWENIDKFSPEFQSQNDKEEATDILNLNNETLRGKSKNII